MRKALNKTSKVCKIGACPLCCMGTKIWHNQLKFTTHSYRNPNSIITRSCYDDASHTAWGAVESPFKLERGKILGTQTGIFSMCPDFFWDLAMKSLTKTCVSPKNLRKIQGKKGSCLLLRKEGLSCPKVFAARVKTVFLRYSAYLAHQKDLSLCYIITQRCHSGLFIFFFLTDFILDTSINFPLVAFPLQAKASQFQY